MKTQPKFNIILQPVDKARGHGVPPLPFLETVFEWVCGEKDIVFDRNPNFDVFSVLKEELGPFDDVLHRRAIAAHVLTVVGGYESDFDFKEGRDTTAQLTKPENQEAGAFQVSFDSVRLGADLKFFAIQNGIVDPVSFQKKMKENPLLDCAYTWRLLRITTRWDGPFNRGWIEHAVKRECVDEWARLLKNELDYRAAKV